MAPESFKGISLSGFEGSRLPGIDVASRGISDHGPFDLRKAKAVAGIMDNEDGPVVVAEEDVAAAEARASGGHSDDLQMDGGRKVPLAALNNAESDEVKQQHKNLTWRERAMQARRNNSNKS